MKLPLKPKSFLFFDPKLVRISPLPFHLMDLTTADAYVSGHHDAYVSGHT
jgi:hypothetical protein